jgi:hypothetical protein
MRHI